MSCTARGRMTAAHCVTKRARKATAVSVAMMRQVSCRICGPWQYLPAPNATGGTANETVHPVMQTPLRRAASTGRAPGKEGNSDACCTATLPTWLERKDLVNNVVSTSSRMTSSSACSASMLLSNCVQKSDAAVGPPPLSASPSVGETSSSKPSQKKSACWKLPSPRTTSFTPATLAICSAGLPGSVLMTATRAAAEAGTHVACTSACSGVTSSEPASTSTRIRETIQGSCNEERTSGNGSETPSSGSMSQAPSAPSISTCWAPCSRATSLPTTTGSSRWSRRSSRTRSECSTATTRIMPRPQLKVDDSSRARILPTAASQRKATGSSHASARNCAVKCDGNTSSKARPSPPLATCAAPRSKPSRAAAKTGLT
mmetsp:Transcript_62927/g.146512  ORF Transcript_62927/g.146512 Transcript_62927/m.146512 type:complete len:373 (-) Transcript_62927:1046-2164(-)